MNVVEKMGLLMCLTALGELVTEPGDVLAALVFFAAGGLAFLLGHHLNRKQERV